MKLMLSLLPRRTRPHERNGRDKKERQRKDELEHFSLE
jgi:hypothetical protein